MALISTVFQTVENWVYTRQYTIHVIWFDFRAELNVSWSPSQHVQSAVKLIRKRKDFYTTVASLSSLVTSYLLYCANMTDYRHSEKVSNRSCPSVCLSVCLSVGYFANQDIWRTWFLIPFHWANTRFLAPERLRIYSLKVLSDVQTSMVSLLDYSNGTLDLLQGHKVT